jgi:hypothetical protein
MIREPAVTEPVTGGPVGMGRGDVLTVADVAVGLIVLGYARSDREYLRRLREMATQGQDEEGALHLTGAAFDEVVKNGALAQTLVGAVPKKIIVERLTACATEGAR